MFNKIFQTIFFGEKNWQPLQTTTHSPRSAIDIYNMSEYKLIITSVNKCYGLATRAWGRESSCMTNQNKDDTYFHLTSMLVCSLHFTLLNTDAGVSNWPKNKHTK